MAFYRALILFKTRVEAAAWLLDRSQYASIVMGFCHY